MCASVVLGWGRGTTVKDKETSYINLAFVYIDHVFISSSLNDIEAKIQTTQAKYIK